jgi:UDP-N-acetylmuramate--alanine ligase
LPSLATVSLRDDTRRAVDEPPRVHLVGIAGSGMRSLAGALAGDGWAVSGSDPRARLLACGRICASSVHRAEAIDEQLDLVVYSDAVPRDNVELKRALELGVPAVSYPQMLARLMKGRSGVAIAGTHGKSTTTAMAGEILAAAGLEPSLVYGATPIDPASGSRLGRGRWMLVEACEYRANFHHLSADMAAITAIELDHVDCFASLADVESAFATFARRVPAEGLVMARADCAATARVTAGLDCAVETFGLTTGATWHAARLRERRGCYSFELRRRGRLVCEIKMPLPGAHNVLNALAAAALASHCGASAAAIRAGLERFAGLRRRLELVTDNGAMAVVDDYAHHPTEVAASLAAVRQMYPARRIWCVFEPHQRSRTARLLDEFARSLHNADKIVVTEIARVREDAPGDATAARLVERIKELGGDATFRANRQDILDHVRAGLAPLDVLVTLGAADIGTIAHDVGQGLRELRKAG